MFLFTACSALSSDSLMLLVKKKFRHIWTPNNILCEFNTYQDYKEQEKVYSEDFISGRHWVLLMFHLCAILIFHFLVKSFLKSSLVAGSLVIDVITSILFSQTVVIVRLFNSLVFVVSHLTRQLLCICLL